MSVHTQQRGLTIPDLHKAKQSGHKIAMLTAYDASFAHVLDANGVDSILVGDSLGMVVQGHRSTLPVTIADMIYHTRCVASQIARAVLVADMPFQADATFSAALEAAASLLRVGAQMVKIEGAGLKLEIIHGLVHREIPVCAHLGLTPQSVLRLGGYKVQGKGSAAEQLRADARAVVDAGASMLVLECVPSGIAHIISEELPIPVIGIGAGPHCDGQILVLHDVLGIEMGHPRPKFVKDFLAGASGIAGAVQSYVQAVQSRQFPSAEHSYGLI